jgi:Lon protease-like protein
LHVFEPRYRLMIRRCMESGSRQFGMCAYLESQPHGFAQYGTMLEVRDVEFFADGRSVVDTVGGRRFKVLHQSLLDGYYTANVEFLADQPPVEASHTAAVVALHQRVRESAESWINSAPASLRQRILQHFGTIPPVEADWITLPNGPAWLWWLMAILPLDSKAQLAILSMTRVEKRLEAIHRVVAHVRSRQSL